MDEFLNLVIVTPEKIFYEGKIKELETENINGRIGILPNHIPLITTLKENITKIKDSSDKELKLFASKGIMEVKDNNIRMLCDACEWPNEIDIDRAKKARDRALKRLKSNDKSIDKDRAERALKRATIRLKIKDSI